MKSTGSDRGGQLFPRQQRGLHDNHTTVQMKKHFFTVDLKINFRSLTFLLDRMANMPASVQTLLISAPKNNMEDF